MVTGLTRLAGRIMGNFSPVTDMAKFSSVTVYMGNFKLGYRDEQGAIFQVSSR